MKRFYFLKFTLSILLISTQTSGTESPYVEYGKLVTSIMMCSTTYPDNHLSSKWDRLMEVENSIRITDEHTNEIAKGIVSAHNDYEARRKLLNLPPSTPNKKVTTLMFPSEYCIKKTSNLEKLIRENFTPLKPRS